MTVPAAGVCLYAEGAQNLQHFERGIPRYVVEHARALYSGHRESLHSVLMDQRFPMTGNLAWLGGSGLLDWQTDGPPAARERPAVYHVMSPFELNISTEAMWPHWARDARIATVVTLYDLIPLVFADRYLSNPRIRSEYEARLGLIRSADQVLAISQISADDAIEHLGISEDRVHVIHAGATDSFGPMFRSKAAAGAHLRRRLPQVAPGFMLYVGGFEFRKNLEGMISGYARMPEGLRREHQLVIVCRMLPAQMEQLAEHGRQLGLADDELILTGYIDDEDLGALYHSCELFVFPSLYEGSGLPILEAMSCEAPVAAAQTSTGPELVGDPRAMFDPRSPDSIAGCLSGLLRDPEELDRLRAVSRERVRDYTWTHVADHTMAGYERALSRPSRPRRRSRARLALVSPWLPVPSGVGDYNVQLAAELGKLVDIDVFVDDLPGGYPAPEEPGTSVHPAGAFAAVRRMRQHDRILYCMGNSQYHAHVYELLSDNPGAVLFHDVQLTGFYSALSQREDPENGRPRLAARIDAMYDRRLPDGESSEGSLEWDRLSALGLYMTREIQTLADQSFVHSLFARDVLQLEQSRQDHAAPVGMLPYALPHAPGPVRRAPGPSPVVISLGYIHEIKGLGTLIRAFGLLSDDLPGAKLILAGPVDESGREHWTRFIAEHADGADIEMTGWVSKQTFTDLARRADLSVQLRLASNGEASGAVAEALAAGLPAVVTDMGWAGELPDAAVAKVPQGVTPDRLRTVMLDSLTDAELYVSRSEAALTYARDHTFARVARAYVDALHLT